MQETSLYSYSAAATPTVTGVAAAAGVLSVTGTQFGSGPTVLVGAESCQVVTASESEVTCNLPSLAGGRYNVTVNNPALGDSAGDLQLEIELSLASSTPGTGSFGGGTELTLAGQGFSSAANVTVCGLECAVQSASTSQLVCLTPPNSDTGATLACEVSVVQQSGSVFLSNAFTYDASLTPTVTAVSPLRGGTGGGTLLTITGTGFSTTANTVSIAGSSCDIASQSSTEITCYTNHHAGAVEALVTVEVPVPGPGTASNNFPQTPSTESQPSLGSAASLHSSPSTEFSSRFLSDFQPVQVCQL